MQEEFGGDSDGFVTRLDPSGRLVFFTFLGGQEIDASGDVEIDPEGNTVVGGVTHSLDFLVVQSIVPSSGGGICRSTDAGTSWSLASIGIPCYRSTRNLDTSAYGSAGVLHFSPHVRT